MKSTANLPSGSRMTISFKLRGAYALCIFTCAAVLPAQTANKTPAEPTLQQHFDDAQAFQRTGRLNDAADQYRAFIADALAELAAGYGLARDYTQAAPFFDEALALEPNSSSLLLGYARTALTLGDLDHAKTLASEFIRRYPANREPLAEAHQILGRTLLKLNRDQEARKEFETALALDPTFPNGYNLAVACLNLEDDKCAAQIFSEMEKAFGDTAEIHVAFGRAYGDSDFQSRAITEFKRAIEENPHLPGTHYLLAALLMATGGDQSHVSEAEAALKQELVISPNDPMTYASLGKIAANNSRYSEAETYLKKSIQLDPQNPDPWLFLGQMYFATNRPAEAETALRQSIALTQDVSRNRYQIQTAHFMLGRILMQKGQQDAAHAEMQISRDLSNRTLSRDRTTLAALLDTSGPQDAPAAHPTPTSRASAPVDPLAFGKVESLREQLRLPIADSYNNLGAIAATNSDYGHAVAYFKQAAVWNPSLEGLDYNWGRAAFAGSQFADAIMPLSRFLKSHPDDTGARSVLAISQFMIGDYPACIQTLEPAIGKVDLAPQAEYVYAESLIKTGRTADGEQRLKKLEKSHPEISGDHQSSPPKQ